jgi:nucleotide-binding universal stress UspA family protein
LGDATQSLEAAGITVTASIVESHAIYRGILETASSAGADLIVMGSHGRRGLEKLVLGSVAAQVLAHAHLPILIVRD